MVVSHWAEKEKEGNKAKLRSNRAAIKRAGAHCHHRGNQTRWRTLAMEHSPLMLVMVEQWRSCSSKALDAYYRGARLADQPLIEHA